MNAKSAANSIGLCVNHEAGNPETASGYLFTAEEMGALSGARIDTSI